MTPDTGVTAPWDIGQRYSRQGILSAAIVTVILLLIGAAATPFAAIPLYPVPGFVVAFGSAMIVVNALLAVILFSRGAVERRAEATALGGAYLFVAIIFIPLIASFPNGLVAGSLIGMPASSGWLLLFWHAGFVVAILHYAQVARSAPQTPSAWRSVGVVMVAVLVLSVIGILFPDNLPTRVQDGSTLFGGLIVLGPLLILAGSVYATFRIATLPNNPPEQLPLTVAMIAACIDMWLTYQGTARFALGWYLSKGCSIFTSGSVLVSLLHQMNFIYSRNATANGVLAGLARQDGLTGLINRRGLDEAIDAAWARSLQTRMPVSLIMIDVDHFKRFNDRYGHPAGDNCLRKVAGVLIATTRRPHDSAARYGGEEFAVLLPMTDADGAGELACRLRSAIQALTIPHDGSTSGILSVSIGVASMLATIEGETASLIAAADRALYRAKAAGRDTICMSDDIVARPAAIEEINRMPAPVAADDPAGRALRSHRSDLSPALSAFQCDVLEAIACGLPLNQVALRLCTSVVNLVPSIGCSVMALDDVHGPIRLAHSGLPLSFLEHMASLERGHGFGSCAATAATGHAVEIHDVATNQLWVPASSIPMEAGLHASWSSPIRDRDGKAIGVFSLFYRSPRAPNPFERDLVEISLHLLTLAMAQEVVRSQLRAASRRFDGTLGALSQGICIMADGRLVMANHRYSEIYSLPPGVLLPGMTFDTIHALQLQAGSMPHVLAHSTEAGRAPEPGSAKLPKTPACISDVPACRSETIVELANGRVIVIHERQLSAIEFVTTHEDITERRLSDTRIVHALRHDALTGLPNRVLFEERLEQAIALAARGHYCAAMSLDIDVFESINDSFGRGVGDRLLQGVADRLDACVSDVDTVAHLGSDKFAIVLVGLERPEGAAELAKRIRQIMLKPFDVGGISIKLGISMGIAVSPNDGATPGKLLKCADAALSRAKLDERGTYRYFEPALDTRFQQRFDLEHALHLALERDEFELYYQPRLISPIPRSPASRHYCVGTIQNAGWFRSPILVRLPSRRASSCHSAHGFCSRPAPKQ